MNKVAVFGNAGGGKSTLSKRLAKMTGLPLVALDQLKYKAGGEEVPHGEFKIAHDQILQQNQWLIDGFGSLDTLWTRLDAADTLVYVDMPVLRHYWWVTKRFLKGLFTPPEGWPENSPLLIGTLNSYSTIRLCDQRLTPKYREYVHQAKETKQVYHLQSCKDVEAFYQAITIKLTK